MSATNINEVGTDFAPLYHVETSDEIEALFEALSKLQAELSAVPKSRTAEIQTKTGGKYRYKYADLSDCRRALKPHLAKHKLALFHTTEPSRISAGEIILVTWLTLGNQWIRSYLPMGQLPNDAQRVGGRLSYYKRYAECAVTGLVVIDEDNEDDLRDAQDQDKKEARKTALSASLQQAIKTHHATINAIKDALAANDLSKAAEAWYELPAEEQSLLFTAPSKGGPFTTAERGIIKARDFREAHFGPTQEKES